MNKIIKSIGFRLLLGLSFAAAQAQVGMTTNNQDNNAVLDLNTQTGSNTKGLLLPNVALTTTDSATPFSAHVAGMHVYNTATAGSGATGVIPGEYYNDGIKWVRIQTNAWELNTNSGTNSASNFVGTTNGKDLVFKTNNTEVMRLVASNGVINNSLVIGRDNGGVKSTEAKAKLLLDNGTTAGAIQIKDGTEGDGKILVSDENGVATWFRGGDTAEGTGIYRNTIAQTFTPSGQILQTSSTIKMTAGGSYMVSIRWWGACDGPDANSTTSAYFNLYKNGVKVDGLEYYTPLRNEYARIAFTINLLALNCAPNDVLTIQVSPSAGKGNRYWYTAKNGNNSAWMPSVVVMRL